MAGPTSLKVAKALLTRYCNNLQRLTEESEEALKAEEFKVWNVHKSQEVQRKVMELEANINLVSQSLEKFANVVDSVMDSVTDEQEQQVQEYIDKAQTTIDQAQNLTIQLESARISARDHAGDPTRSTSSSVKGHGEAPTAQLPPIPVPTFTGELWDFENFWRLFEANVDQQPLSKLQKFNYLINALQGEARELINRFTVTEDNYEEAVAMLRRKYGDRSRLVAKLQQRLEETHATSTSTAAQRRLLETIIPLVSQLEAHKVYLDGSFAAQKLLSKFSASIQRKILQQYITPDMQEENWHMKDIITALDDCVSTEERITEMMTHAGTATNTYTRRTRTIPFRDVNTSASCLFCNDTTHRMAACNKLNTTAQRRRFFQESNRCLNCASQGHFVKDCRSPGCRACPGQKHHHTLCPKRNENEGWAQKPQAQSFGTTRNLQRSLQQEDIPSHSKPTARTHLLSAEDPSGEPQTEQVQDNKPATVLHNEERLNRGEESFVSLLTGIAQIWNPREGKWMEVEILFDTGADQSFIGADLAKRIGAEHTQTKCLQTYTFGTAEPRCVEYGVTNVKICDHQGQLHALTLFATPILTGKGKSASLNAQDQSFINEHKIQLSRKQTSNSCPEILLGCDQLWNFLDAVSPQFKLPSGLLLVPSKFGYLLTGKQHKVTEASEKIPEAPRASSVAMVQVFTNFETDFEEDRDRWDKYWTIDSAGICEFTGTKDAEKEANNAKVAQFFNDTIQRRDDGYYVRLPFKEDHPYLPNNKAIAKKRLNSILHMLKSKPDLLQTYDQALKDQLEKGIIQEIPGDGKAVGKHLHYIPHQPVITPHKETTKLRIVFDASSHFKDCPSLNDVLHQGPLILPDLYAMLLRFRMASFAATADVEKAFLQVHLHELDRDATRFLWVRNINLPAEEDNIVTYRFTRVTFGLNVSPFLLAGTIHYHLEHSVLDQPLAKEIRENLYVDNLILTAHKEEELNKKAVKARKIFTEMGMNLREFLSNTSGLHEMIPEEALARGKSQKILGLQWDAEKDSITISCKIPKEEHVTKRLVARHIASVYDPLGWLVPLMVKMKVFQQHLWKQGLQWDERLPDSLQEKWHSLREEMDGFQKSLPRMVLTNATEFQLAIFADANEECMAACAYLLYDKSVNLVMAKSKLASIKVRTTIPKMELNAITIATRLALAVYKAVKTETSPRTMHILSDSQVALSWVSSDPQQIKPGVLVRNRVNEIYKIVSTLEEEGVAVNFHYTTSEDNPADAGTRGLKSHELENHPWWTGPEFLRRPKKQWPTQLYYLKRNADEKSESATTALIVCETSGETGSATTFLDMTRFSSFQSAKRTAAIALIFLKKLTRRLNENRRKQILSKITFMEDIQDGPLPVTGPSILAARLAIINDHQRCYISPDYRKSMDNTLRLFQDEFSIWRSRGRIGMSTLDPKTKNPIFIAPKTRLAHLIIAEAHGRYHRSTDHTMMTVRRQYWIPQLRQQVRTFIQKCVNCRRFNALPYHYPETQDLPQRRVQRSRPFQHVGLDFFDLPTLSKEDNEKQYGCIFTCTVTRMIHLEVTNSMSTEDFLNALRRFIARRGIPESITCDNAPTFLLSSTILEEGRLDSCLPANVADTTSNMGIKWHHITPYAPWQGAFYERLIRSIKHALYKALRGLPVRTKDDLYTILTEVEACLNSRPLTYQSSSHEDFSAIRPIDFYQNELEVTFPLDGSAAVAESDAEYLPPHEMRALQTRQQAEEAIKSSCRITEKFWKIWQEQYLTFLREKHVKNISRKRLGQETPKKGSVVLVSDPVLPRNSWKLARITDVRQGSDGAIREVELQTSSKRKIRRPVNLLIPLELEEEDIPEGDTESIQQVPQEEELQVSRNEQSEKRYDLRPRQPMSYVENVMTTPNENQLRNSRAKWFLFYIMLSMLTNISHGEPSKNVKLSCSENGVHISAHPNVTFEVCAENYCKLYQSQSKFFALKFPPEITLHDYTVSVKWMAEQHLSVMETRCPALKFCENIDCSLCITILLNPECWPTRAILLGVVLLYVTVALLYLLLYVPMTIGKPIRLIIWGTVRMIILFIGMVRCCIGILSHRTRRLRTRQERIAAILAIVIILGGGQQLDACQYVNVLEHHSTVCTVKEGKEECTFVLSETLKINTFKQEACLHLTANNSLIANVKIKWLGLYLTCERETLYFTRSTELRTIDSKRCPHMGSCTGNKCADVNSTTLLPELHQGNQYPGRTGCFESCGGLGCDCFYPSSGCLFYRIYAVPTDEKIYEMFRCARWAETVKLEFSIENTHSKEEQRRHLVTLIPNVPQDFSAFRITMTTIALPPTPTLADMFITDGEETAIWQEPFATDLFCSTWQKANSSDCILRDSCQCAPAESWVNCQCLSKDLTQEFNRVDLKLPVQRSSGELRLLEGILTAKIPQMVSAEFILTTEQTVSTEQVKVLVKQDRCTISDSEITGCYNCVKGAEARIQCSSSRETLAEVLCEQNAFVVPCAPDAPQSTLQFHLDHAKQLLNCSVYCGETHQFFVLTGVLKYVGNWRAPMLRMMARNSTVYGEFAWPDFSHILEVFFAWYKTLMITLLGVGLLVLIIYLSIQRLGISAPLTVLRIFVKICCVPMHIVIRLRKCLQGTRSQHRSHFHQKTV